MVRRCFVARRTLIFGHLKRSGDCGGGVRILRKFGGEGRDREAEAADIIALDRDDQPITLGGFDRFIEQIDGGLRRFGIGVAVFQPPNAEEVIAVDVSGIFWSASAG